MGGKREGEGGRNRGRYSTKKKGGGGWGGGGWSVNREGVGRKFEQRGGGKREREREAEKVSGGEGREGVGKKVWVKRRKVWVGGEQCGWGRKGSRGGDRRENNGGERG